MTAFTRHDVPADIAVFLGEFASQPLVFAHLLDAVPTIDLGHVEVVQTNPGPRLSAHFEPETVAHLLALKEGFNTLVLILPAAYPGLECPLGQTAHLVPIGSFRGTVPHMSVTP